MREEDSSDKASGEDEISEDNFSLSSELSLIKWSTNKRHENRKSCVEDGFKLEMSERV